MAIWIPHELQVAKPRVTIGESEWALSDEFGNYACDFSSAISGEKEGIGNAFRSKWQAFTMIFAQKEGIANAFTYIFFTISMHRRHGKFSLPNLIM